MNRGELTILPPEEEEEEKDKLEDPFICMLGFYIVADASLVVWSNLSDTRRGFDSLPPVRDG